MKNKLTYSELVEASAVRHISSFVHMATEGEKSYTAAWEVIKSRTALGPDSLALLWDRCAAAATLAKSA